MGKKKPNAISSEFYAERYQYGMWICVIFIQKKKKSTYN